MWKIYSKIVYYLCILLCLYLLSCGCQYKKKAWWKVRDKAIRTQWQQKNRKTKTRVYTFYRSLLWCVYVYNTYINSYYYSIHNVEYAMDINRDIKRVSRQKAKRDRHTSKKNLHVLLQNLNELNRFLTSYFIFWLSILHIHMYIKVRCRKKMFRSALEYSSFLDIKIWMPIDYTYA